MSEVIQRTAPLLSLRQRTLDERRGAFAAAARASEAARAAVIGARELWDAQAVRVSATTFGTVAEHADARAHVASLWKAALRAADVAMAADQAERAAREAMLEAERELKKVETWRDGLLEEARAEEARRERRVTDELAARTHEARTSP